MPTPAERRALMFVAAVAVLGTAVRGAGSRRAGPPTSDRAALADQIARVDSAIASGGRRRAPTKATAATTATKATSPADASARAARNAPRDARPTRPDPLDALRQSPLDPDRADSAALDRLPGVGPALASRIIADREANGPFGSLDGLQRVKGIGPGLAKRVAPYVTFRSSGRPPPMGPAAPEQR